MASTVGVMPTSAPEARSDQGSRRCRGLEETLGWVAAGSRRDAYPRGASTEIWRSDLVGTFSRSPRCTQSTREANESAGPLCVLPLLSSSMRMDQDARGRDHRQRHGQGDRIRA